MSSVEQEYIVQKSDTLVTLSIRFNTTVQWLCEINNLPNDFIYTGQKIKIRPPGPMERSETAYEVELQSEKDNSNGIEAIGSLTCKSGLLSFIPNGEYAPTVIIDLISHLRSAFVDESDIKNETADRSVPYAILVVTYLRDKNDALTLSTASFSGRKDSLQVIYELLNEQAKIIQKNSNYVAPEVLSSSNIVSSDNDAKKKSVPEPQKQKIETAAPTPKRIKKKRALRPIKMVGTSRILRPDDVLSIREMLPYHYKLQGWKLLYQLSSHGSSYLSFFEKCQNASPVVCIILNDAGERIGAYISSGFKVSRNFYGSGETFVFKCQPSFEGFKWENANKYFVATSKDEIAIGGGGASAIWVDGKFLNAFSEPCPTFGSPGLTASPNFKIMEIEVWQISDA